MEMENNNGNSRKRCSAIWAKETGETKFKSNDLNGAIECANVAKALFPDLDGIDKILAAYEVHVAASTKKINGQIDWYAVLGLDSSAQLETVKKQYKRKSLMVHPDKNKSIAADGAFKLISEAWKVLSDAAPTRMDSTRRSSSSGPSFSSSCMKACPRCNKACSYDTVKRSSITCVDCGRRFVFIKRRCH